MDSHPEHVALSVFDNVDFLSLLFDADGRCIHANRTVATVLGKAPASLRGLTVEEILGDVVPPQALTQLREMRLARPATEIEIPISVCDGQPRWFRVTLACTEIGCMLLGRDITDYHATEVLHQKWAHIIEQAEFGIAVCDAEGKTLEQINPAYARMHGYSVDELTGKPVSMVYAPGRFEDVRRAIQENPRSEHYRYESEHVHRDGRVFPVEVDVTAICDESGRVQYHIINTRNITQQVAAREELQVRKEFFRRTFTDAPLAMAIADLTGRYICVNAAMCDMLGYSEPELLQMTYHDVTHPDDVAENDERRDDLVAGAIESFEMEKRYVCKDGRVVWSLMVVSIIKGPDGKALVTLGQMLDIDRLKHAEEALQKSEAWFRGIFENANTGIAATDTSGRVTSFNEAFRDMLGYDTGALMSLNFADFTHPDDLKQEAVFLDEILAHERDHYRITKRYLARDGRTIWVDISVAAIRNAKDEVANFVAVVNDITEQKTAELALVESNRSYQSVLSTTLDGFWINDSQGRFIEVNDRYCQLSGYSREEFLGMHIMDVEASERPEETAAHIRHVFATGSDQFESRHRRKDGSVWDVEISTVSDLSGDGKLYVFTRDISERKRAKNALQESNYLLNAIINTAPIRVFWKDMNLRFLGCNLAFAIDAGKTRPDELVGKDDFDMVWKDQADIYRADDRKVIESGIPKLFYEEPQTTADGRTIWLRTSKVPLRDRQDEIIGVLGIYEDITERKKTEQALRENEARLKRAQIIAGVYDWRWTLASGQVEVFGPYTHVLGIPPAENDRIRRDVLFGWLDDAERTRIEKLIESSIAERQPITIEHRFPHLHNGHPERIFLTHGATELSPTGAVVSFHGTTQDVTQSKQYEQEVIHSREQLRALAAYHEQMLEEERKRIAHEIHDELGQQLSVLKLDVGMLRQDFGGDPGIVDLAQRMRHGIDHAFNVVRQVASHLRPAALELGIVAAIEWLASELASRWGIDCEIDAPGDIAADEATAITAFRIVQESLTNVARHSGARHVSITLRKDGGDLRIVVRDDGHGFDIEGPSARSGHGLFAMRERVRSRHGTIVVESAAGAGTAISVTLPMTTP